MPDGAGAGNQGEIKLIEDKKIRQPEKIPAGVDL